MPLGLHANAQRSLVAALSAELGTIEVENNSFLAHKSTKGLTRLDAIIPGPNSQVGHRIAGILGDEPVSDFVYDQLSILLRARQFLSDVPSTPLTSLDEFRDAEQLAVRLIAEFESLPWDYSLFVAIPFEIAKRISSAMSESVFELNEAYRVVQFTADDREYPSWLEGAHSLLGVASEKNFEPGRPYLNARLSGYVGRYLGLRPVEDFSVALRGFFGIGIAERVFKPRYHHFVGDRSFTALVFRKDNNAWIALKPAELDTGTANLLHGIGPDEMVSKPEEPRTKHWINDFLKCAHAAFSESSVSDRLLGASQWLFDSYSGSNALLAFVQAMVALEILFGDKAVTDLVGLGELLANRCAYSIATSRVQREEVLTDFRRIYGTRSRIVHRGLTRLSHRDEADLQTLRWMVMRALQEEIKLCLS